MPAWLDDVLWTYQNLVHALGVNGLLALSMYVVLAAGQLSLGQAAFMGLGAYSSAIMTLKLGLPFAAVLPLSVVTPVLFALAVGGPTLRLSGVYLAIATIGLGEVLRTLYLNVDYFGGALGLSGIPERAETYDDFRPPCPRHPGPLARRRSRIGRAMEAMREDETAAAVMGVPSALQDVVRSPPPSSPALPAPLRPCQSASSDPTITASSRRHHPLLRPLGRHRHPVCASARRMGPDPPARTPARLHDVRLVLTA